jgi:hypothetical protein
MGVWFQVSIGVASTRVLGTDRLNDLDTDEVDPSSAPFEALQPTATIIPIITTIRLGKSPKLPESRLLLV